MWLKHFESSGRIGIGLTSLSAVLSEMRNPNLVNKGRKSEQEDFRNQLWRKSRGERNHTEPELLGSRKVGGLSKSAVLESSPQTGPWYSRWEVIRGPCRAALAGWWQLHSGREINKLKMALECKGEATPCRDFCFYVFLHEKNMYYFGLKPFSSRVWEATLKKMSSWIILSLHLVLLSSHSPSLFLTVIS